jgi:hypothetical protein
MPPIREHKILYTFLGDEDDADIHEPYHYDGAEEDEEGACLARGRRDVALTWDLHLFYAFPCPVLWLSIRRALGYI